MNYDLISKNNYIPVNEKIFNQSSKSDYLNILTHYRNSNNDRKLLVEKIEALSSWKEILENVIL